MSEAVVMPPKPRERINYNMNIIVPALLERVRGNDREFEDAINAFVTAYSDATITEPEFRDHLVRLMRLFKSNTDLLTTLLALDISGSEAALREVEHWEKRKATA